MEVPGDQGSVRAQGRRDDAINHPTKLLYNDSTVALDANTGKLKWYMQAILNDFHDWDMQIGSMYTDNGPNGQPTVIDAGKMPSDVLVVKQVTNGGGGMPAFGLTLSQPQIKSVALFVSSVAGKPVKGKVPQQHNASP
ncbi:MAG TPA: hypothetical protein VFW09_21355 [Solirubrobacteraceae bacterium]|nr:hypothetical protein [Solirubrobacteraceae bacterium]